MDDVLAKLKHIAKKNERDELEELKKDVKSLEESVSDLSAITADAIQEIHKTLGKIQNRLELIDRTGTIGNKKQENITIENKVDTGDKTKFDSVEGDAVIGQQDKDE